MNDEEPAVHVGIINPQHIDMIAGTIEGGRFDGTEYLTIRSGDIAITFSVRVARLINSAFNQHLRRMAMTGEMLHDCAKGLLQGAVSSGMSPPFRIVCPAGTNLGEFWDGEGVTLEQRLKDLDGVKEVRVGKGRGVSIESVGQEEAAKNRGG